MEYIHIFCSALLLTSYCLHHLWRIMYRRIQNTYTYNATELLLRSFPLLLYFLYSVYLPQRILLDFPFVSSPASLSLSFFKHLSPINLGIEKLSWTASFTCVHALFKKLNLYYSNYSYNTILCNIYILPTNCVYLYFIIWTMWAI